MSKPRKRYSQEFKREAVGLVKSSDKTVTKVASELGINAQMLSRWARQLDESGKKAFPGAGNARDEEVYRLKRQLKKVEKERDFLRQAAAFFAKDLK